jgi:hypothetical protein
MKKQMFLCAAMVLTIASNAFAADDGNTKWRLNHGNLFAPSSSYDIISTTSGAGNVKGVHCATNEAVNVSVYVNGGAAETFTYDPGLNDAGFIPFNIRFTSSIRVSMSRGLGNYGDNQCWVSWGLD